MKIKKPPENIAETKMCVLENRLANKIFNGGRDMFNKVKINDGLKETKIEYEIS